MSPPLEADMPIGEKEHGYNLQFYLVFSILPHRNLFACFN